MKPLTMKELLAIHVGLNTPFGDLAGDVEAAGQTDYCPFVLLNELIEQNTAEVVLQTFQQLLMFWPFLRQGYYQERAGLLHHDATILEIFGWNQIGATTRLVSMSQVPIYGGVVRFEDLTMYNLYKADELETVYAQKLMA